MKPGKAADDLKMTKLFGPDVHQEIFAIGIFAIGTLDGILHGCGELPVGAAKLLKQHVSESGIRLVDTDSIYEVFDVGGVVTDLVTEETSVPGVYVAGDVSRGRESGGCD